MSGQAEYLQKVLCLHKAPFFFALFSDKVLLMEIIRASVMGFCFGVRRAVELAEKALAENPGKKVYSLGPLIHNENALRTLEEKGLHILQEEDIPLVKEASVVIIRAHGVAPSLTKKLEEKQCLIIDATCPRVKASQKMVERYTHQNDYVILTGDRNHGEVIGIAGYAGENFSQIQDYAEAEKQLVKSSRELTGMRKASAEKLGIMIKEALGELNFNQTEFTIEISEKDAYSANGTDECTFMMSMNPGESARPLQDVASGGELSRIMLGIKSVMAGKDGVGTLIFDEIDAGISGRTAQKVSEKLSKIATGHQVICITHLAQLASMADSHYEILKQVEDGRTRTSIPKLEDEEIIGELARLIGGAELTDKVYESAREMKKLADERKKSIRS